MENKQKVLQLLGLARRARKVETGVDLALAAVRSGKAKLVFCASDAGKNTIKKMTDKCQSYAVMCSLDLTQIELSDAIGSKRSVVAVTDTGFSKKFMELLAD